MRLTIMAMMKLPLISQDDRSGDARLVHGRRDILHICEGGAAGQSRKFGRDPKPSELFPL